MKMKDILDRARLKGVGEFLLGNEDALFACLEPDLTAKNLLEQGYDDLQLAGGDNEAVEKAMKKLEEINRRIGFYMGMKAGARLVMELLGEGEARF